MCKVSMNQLHRPWGIFNKYATKKKKKHFQPKKSTKQSQRSQVYIGKDLLEFYVHSSGLPLTFTMKFLILTARAANVITTPVRNVR